jgi:hypothetical protein
LGEHGADQRGDHRPLPVRRRRQQVAHRVDAAALPGSALEAAADRLDQSGVCVGDHQLDAGDAAVGEVGEELSSEHVVLRVADIDTEHFAVTVSA